MPRRSSTALPDLHILYLRCIQDGWLTKAKKESFRRVMEAQSPSYDPQRPTEKLGPWGSGLQQRAMTVDEMLEQWEEERMGDLLESTYDDDVGYNDYEWDNGGMNAADGAIDAEAFDSRWDRNS
jgi:hypothetical protein